MAKSIRWAFNVAKWVPTKKEWILIMRKVQTAGGERDKIRSFKYLHDAKATLVGKLLLRRFWWRGIGGTKEEYFSRSDKGRPQLENNSGWDFNVSHQGSYVVFAAEKGASVGVDVMKITDAQKDLSRFFYLMKRQFTPGEWNAIEGAGQTDDERLAAFYRHWCLKESFVKADGQGLNWNLQRLEFGIKTKILSTEDFVCDTSFSIDSKVRPDWHFHENLLDEEHSVSVAINSSEPRAPVKFETLRTIDDVIEGLADLSEDLSADKECRIFSAMNAHKPF